MVHGTSAKRLTVVTGGGSDIGQRICVRLAREGCFVVVWDDRFGAALSLVSEIEREGGEAAAFQVDFMDRDALDRAAMLTAGDWGSPTLLINCGVPASPVADQLTLAAVCVRALSPLLKDKGSGIIVNVFSTHWQASEERFAIADSTEALAKRMAPFGIRVNGLLGVGLSESLPRATPGTSPQGDLLETISSLCSQDCSVPSGTLVVVG